MFHYTLFDAIIIINDNFLTTSIKLHYSSGVVRRWHVVKSKKTFLSYMLLIAIQCMAPLGLFDAPLSPPGYRSEFISLNRIFVNLPNEEYDVEKVNSIIDRISVFPPKLIDRLIAKNEKMKLINGRLTDEPEYEYLKGKTPRGWEDTGCTWDDVPGIGGNPIVVRIESCGGRDKSHSSVCLELHEVAHRINAIESTRISDGYDFKKLWKAEAPILFENNQYFIDHCNEYFAECYSMYLFDEDTKAALKKNAPLTYEFFSQDFFNALPKPDLSVYRFGGTKICGGIYKNKIYDSYSDIVTDAYFKSSDHLYIAFAATNYGQSTNKPLRLSLWVDGKQIFFTYKGPIKSGQICRFWNISIGKLSPGVHSIIYEVDSNYGVSETDENNNWTEYKIEVE